MSDIDRAYRLAWTQLLESLDAKTTWGRNELMKKMNELLNAALGEVADRDAE